MWSEDAVPAGSARGGCAASQHCRGQWHPRPSPLSPQHSRWSGTLERPIHSPIHDERGGRNERRNEDEKMEEVRKRKLGTSVVVTEFIVS